MTAVVYRNGFGGKIEVGETVEEAANRELNEESNLTATSLVRRGYLVFKMQESRAIMRVHVFQCFEYSGEVRESEEMLPQWYAVDTLPMSSMWPDDAYWMPLLLNDTRTFMGRFLIIFEIMLCFKGSYLVFHLSLRFDYETDDTIVDHSLHFV